MRSRIAVFSVFIACIMLFLPVFEVGTCENVLPVFSVKDDVFTDRNAVYVSASAAVLMDADSGRLLYAKNENKRLPMASTTKIMTCLLACECLDPDSVVTVPKETTGVEGSSIYLEAGEKLTVRELLYGLMLRSGNDAANTLSYAVSGSTDGFVRLMNLKAKSLGLDDTHFANPSGLPDNNHYTTARDLALLASYALKNELFASVVSQKSAVISDGKRYLSNRNKLLFTYRGMTGVKTGYTPEAGKCLVTSASRDGVCLVAVTLNDGNEWNDHASLLDYGFASYESVVIPPISALCSVNGGEKDFVPLSSAEYRITLPSGDGYSIDVPQNITMYAPVKQNDIAAYAVITCRGETVGYIPLCASENVPTKKTHLFERLFR